jgi:hypothetical protein
MPDVKIILGNGNLGRASQTLDGVCVLIGSGVAIEGKFALGDTLAFRSLSDAEAKGIVASYDFANKVLLHQHIKDFFANAGDGAELYVMPVANTVTMEQMCDKTATNVARLLDSLKGRVRMVGVSRTPPSGYAPVYAGQFDPDVWNAAAKAQELFLSEFEKHRPVQFFIEGRDFQGDIASAKDLRNAITGLNANRASIVINQDFDVAALDVRFLKYASVGVAMGRAAAIPVQRNIGRVKDGSVVTGKNIGMSSHEELSHFTETDLASLDTLGYVYLRTRDGKSGLFFNNDHCACVISDDYAYIHRGRPIDKAARLVRETYLNELLDDIEVDAETGNLAPAVVKNYQRAAEKNIEINMLSKGEISGVSVFVDPSQNILSTDKINTVMRIVPKGMANEFEVLLSYENPSV